MDNNPKKWTEQTIKTAILEVMKAGGLSRMPSRSEMYDLTGDNRLLNAVAKSGGFSRWAETIGVEMKSSDTLLGLRYEQVAIDMLQANGFECRWTSVKHPYDILVNDVLKIDVKVSRETMVRGCKVFSFRLAKSMQTCDLYICFCVEGDSVAKTLLIPSQVVSGNVQLCLGAKNSKYNKYQDRWDYVERFVKLYREAFADVI